ncbi:hypothetical protein HMI01_24190 [Halolactibacillus miurensis]|uniref:Fic/DOC family protein n=1 Tax=Halolactibacillus miurensis TaxID=306541 RepID=A0A1I6TTV7_9BACI|nr:MULTISPECIES: Fic family protein [Halolactibacillus]GEM05431.1 hypothetical protein HMI01_24190 [Halolactibacillus miurensis]SFS92662.1 Fic/DOC family protein [Halolactibacillus miurensis]
MDLINHMKYERMGKVRGVYWLFQINMAFNSNKIEGSQLSEEQTQHLFDEEKIYSENGESISLDDINETMNHFTAFDYILDHAHEDIDKDMIKHLHYILKSHTSDEKNPLTPVGDFKTNKNVIGAFNQINTTDPKDVESEIEGLLKCYHERERIGLEDVVDFHVRFEQIHPFADGNGRVGRLIVFKECLKNNIMPSIILDQHRDFYITGLKEYDKGLKERLIDTFGAGQDYCEQLLKNLGFDDQVSSTVEHIKNNEHES